MQQQQSDEIQIVADTDNTLVADASPVAKKKQRRWYFGMGGGSVTAGTSSSLNMYALKNTLLPDPELMSLNSPYFDRDAAKTNIHHNTPITGGGKLPVEQSLFFTIRIELYVFVLYLGNKWISFLPGDKTEITFYRHTFISFL